MVVAEPYNSQSWNRYSYSSNNLINYTDPSGHVPQWLTGVGDFLQGFSREFVRTNNWIGAITSPSYAQSLAPSTSESVAMIAGRIAGDIATIVVGVSEISTGGTIAGGGAVVGCGATLCLAAAPALAAGAAVIAAGVMTTASGSIALGENLGRMYSNNKNSEDSLQYLKSDKGSKGTYQSPYQFPSDPSQPPSPGFSWQGNGEPGYTQGNWVKPNTGEWFHWDPTHHGTEHYDYNDPFGNRFRIWSDGSMSLK